MLGLAAGSAALSTCTSIAVARKLGEKFSHMEMVKGIECCIYKVAKDDLIT